MKTFLLFISAWATMATIDAISGEQATIWFAVGFGVCLAWGIVDDALTERSKATKETGQ